MLCTCLVEPGPLCCPVAPSMFLSAVPACLACLEAGSSGPVRGSHHSTYQPVHATPLSSGSALALDVWRSLPMPSSAPASSYWPPIQPVSRPLSFSQRACLVCLASLEIRSSGPAEGLSPFLQAPPPSLGRVLPKRASAILSGAEHPPSFQALSPSRSPAPPDKPAADPTCWLSEVMSRHGSHQGRPQHCNTVTLMRPLAPCVAPCGVTPPSGRVEDRHCRCRARGAPL